MEAGWAGGVQDRGDPNYDSDVEADRHMRLKSIPIDNTAGCKKEARSALTPEYCSFGCDIRFLLEQKIEKAHHGICTVCRW